MKTLKQQLNEFLNEDDFKFDDNTFSNLDNSGTIVSTSKLETDLDRQKYSEFTKGLSKLLANSLKDFFGSGFDVQVLSSSSTDNTMYSRTYKKLKGNHNEGIVYGVNIKGPGRTGYNGELRTSKNCSWMLKFTMNSNTADLMGTGYLSGNRKITDTSVKNASDFFKKKLPQQIANFVKSFRQNEIIEIIN